MRARNISGRRRGSTRVLCAAAALAVSTFAARRAALAGNTTYSGPNGGYFSTGGNWNTNVAPNSGDNVFVGPNQGSLATQTVNFNYSTLSYSSGGFNSLTIDSPDFTQTMFVTEAPPLGFSYSLSTSSLIIGNGNGVFQQTGRSVSNNTVSGLIELGVTQDSSGEYDLYTNGTLNAGAIDLGMVGLGNFNQSTGSVTVTHALSMSTGAYGFSSYSMTGGSFSAAAIYMNTGNSPAGASFSQVDSTVTTVTLSMANNSNFYLGTSSGSATLNVPSTEFVGNQGSASFVQSGGSNLVGSLYVDTSSSSTASLSTYTLNTGTLSAGSMFINYNSAGMGKFVQSGGVNTVTGDLQLSDGGFGGEYDIGPGATLSVGGTMWMASGDLDGGNGSLKQTGGAVSCAAVNFGYYYGFGELDISGGKFTTGSMNFALGSDSGGTVHQTGGTITIGTAGSPGGLEMSAIYGWTLSYSMDASAAPSALILHGNLDLEGDLATGATSTTTWASFTQNGGTTSIYGNITVGATTTGTSGNLLAFGGTAACSVTGNVYIGGNDSQPMGEGSLSITGGSLGVAGTLNLWNTGGGASLSAGTLAVGEINTHGMPSLFDWTGGTLHLTNSYLLIDAPVQPQVLFGNSLTIHASQALVVESNEWLSGAGAQLIQNGGANSCSTLEIGNSQSAGAATYTLAGGTLTTTSLQILGGNSNALNITGGVASAVSTSNNQSINQTGGTSSLGNVSGSGGIFVGNFAGTAAAMSVASIQQESVFINSTGTVSILNNSTASNQVNALTILPGGRLDLGNNRLIINYAGGGDPISTIRSYLISGYNGGTWTGAGIDSSAAAANSGKYGIGYADGADGVVAGLSSGQIEIMYTLLGDANLDGKVNGSDFAILASNFNKAVSGWDQGDFNYDGKVNGADFSVLAANFNQGIGPGAIAALDQFALANGLASDVPEPGLAGVAAAGAIGLLKRRGHRMRRSLPRPSYG
jgi:hypothetical protein